jgi:hypothetical protein
MTQNEMYLGDGLYVSFDGYQFKLRAPRHPGEDHIVYLEPSIYHAFVAFANKRLTPTAHG